MTGTPGGSAPRTAEDWAGYLVEYGATYVRTANEYVRPRLTAEQVETHWLGAGPASEEALAATEERLGTRLPPGLRTFLAATDGWCGVGGWISEVHGCAEIDWLRDTDIGEDLIELYAEEEVEELCALFRRALLVAYGEDLWLLDPASRGPDGEWAAHEFAPKYGEGEEYASFTELFEKSRKLMLELAAHREQAGPETPSQETPSHE
jgi:hypothetical protein